MHAVSAQGLLRFGLDGGGGGVVVVVVPLEPRNPYSFLRVILQKNVPIAREFSQNIGLFFKFFGCSTWKNGPMIRDIFVEKVTH